MKPNPDSLAISIGSSFNKIGLILTPLTEKLSNKYRFFKILYIIQKNRFDLEYLKNKKFRIISLDETLLLDQNLYGLDEYYTEKRRTRFFKANGEVWGEFGSLILAFPFPQGIYVLRETFREEVYRFYPVRNRTVLDIGAYVGDSAIYFASKGARRVIAFEPAPPLFRLCELNVKMNNLQNIVKVRSEAVSIRPGQTTLNCARDPASNSIYFDIKSSSSYQVKTVAFNKIVEEIGKIDLLKMDCEGEEFKIIPKAQEIGVLRNISNIIVEVHGTPGIIITALQEANFKIQKSLYLDETTQMIYASQN
jgi:FkbM family methyltransferase